MPDKSRQSFLSAVRRRLSRHHEVSVFEENFADVVRWFESTSGRRLLAAELRYLKHALKNLFGYHLMQLSVTPSQPLFGSSRVNHCFSMVSSRRELLHVMADNEPEEVHISGIGRFEELPLPDESIDICVLHHVLEFSEHPQQLLKEAERVLRPRGHLIILCFNPISMKGLKKKFVQYFAASKFYRRHSFSVTRVSDWLGFLDFSRVDLHNLRAGYPLRFLGLHKSSKPSWVKKLVTFWERMPFGDVYCLTVCKDRLAATPLKPEWEKTPLLQTAKVSSISKKLEQNENR